MKLPAAVLQAARPLGLAGLARPPQPGGAHVDLDMRPQLHSEWCWAAVGSAIAAYYGRPRSQCAIVNEVRDLSSCCDSPLPAQCNAPSGLRYALHAVGCEGEIVAGRVSPTRIRSELLAGRPLCMEIAWGDSGGHFVAISGISDDLEHLVIDDPMPGHGRSIRPYGVFPTGYQAGGTWYATLFTRPPES